MITTVAAKLWFAVAALAAVGFAAYELFSDAEWFGSFVLASLSLTALLLGVLAVATRDGSVEGDAAPQVATRQTGPAPWPALGAVGAVVAIVGLAGRNDLLWLGVGILAVTLAEWLVQGWAERATGDPAYNVELRHRLMSPFEIPILSLIVIGVILISLSRVMLAVSKTGSIVVAGAVATVIFVVASLLAAKPRISSSVFAGVLSLGAVALVAAGIAGGVAGERDIEPHHAEGEEHAEPTHEGEEGNNPAADEGGENQSDPGADPVGAGTDGESSDTGGDTPSPGADDHESTPASTP